MAKQRRQPLPHLVRLGRRIAQLRQRRALSQADLAEAIGVATESVSRLERAAATPSLHLLAQIASALDVEVEDLFAGRPPARAARPIDPVLAKIGATVGGKPPAVRRRILRVVRLFLEQ